MNRAPHRQRRSTGELSRRAMAATGRPDLQTREGDLRKASLACRIMSPQRTSPHTQPALPLALGSALLAIAVTPAASAQEALRQSLVGEAASAARRTQQANQAYSLKTGDLKLHIEPSLRLEWVDDLYLSDADQQSDFLISPMLRLDATYPLTEVNRLIVSLGLGYDYYVDHDEWSGLRLEPGSELSFDIFLKDVRLNLHDRMSYVQDQSREAAVANTTRYGGFYNTVGFSAQWDLYDVVATLGYDHYNSLATTSDYAYLDRNTELPVGRLGYQFHPAVTAGMEATGTFNRYSERVLNNSTGFSAGAYAEWQLTEHLQLTPRAGYTSYFFDQTSTTIPAVDQDAWYGGLTLQHRLNEVVSYSVSVGHEMRLGISTDVIEDTYVRPGISWRLVKDISLATFASYEHGRQGGGRLDERYDHFSAGFNLGYQLLERMRASLDYRWTGRSSDVASRDYSQNRIGLQFAYRF